MNPTTFSEAPFGGGGGGLDSPAGDGDGVTSVAGGGGTSSGLGGGEGGDNGKPAVGGGDGAVAGATFDPEEPRLLRLAMTMTTIDSFLRQLFSLPLMK